MIITDALNFFSGGYLFQEKSYTSGQTFIKELSQYSPCKALIEEAQKVIQELGLAALEVRFELTKSKFDAEQEDNIIRIMPNLSAPKQRDCFVFELTNLIQQKKHMEKRESAKRDVYKSAEEYARYAEFIEYNGEKRCKAVSRAINKQNGRFFRAYLENRFMYIPIETIGFNLYYSLFIQNDHKEYHRKKWRILNQSCSSENTGSKRFNNTLKIAFGVSVVAIAFLNC